MSFDYNDPIITRRRKGTSEDPYVSLSEAHVIENGKVVLTEIPNEFNKVTVTGNSETWYEKVSGLPVGNEYVVDYKNKVVTFNTIHDGKQLQFDYAGEGLIFVPTSMIYTKTNNGEVVETLKTIITNGEDALGALDEVANFKHVGDYNSSVTYKRYNIVTLEGSSFIANVDTNAVPTNSSDWDRISVGNEWQGIYASTTTYSKGNQVIDSNKEKVYISLIDGNLNNPLTDTASWNVIFDISGVMNTANTKIDDLTNLETTVSSNETQRQSNETSRSTAEDTRAVNETTRQSNETTRENNETTRVSNENARITSETNRETAESTRSTNETTRQSNETTRESNETTRVNNESTRESNETTRQDNEAIRQSQESDRQTNTSVAITNANTATQNAQKVADNTQFIEEWLSTTTYSKNNIVRLNGSSFMSLQDNNLNNTPDPNADTLYWALMARRGIDGEGSVSTVNNINPDLNGNVSLTAGDVGAETPTGAQTKADTAETNANTYTDGQVGDLTTLTTTDKSSLVGAINEHETRVTDVESNLSLQDQQTKTLQHGLNLIESDTDVASPLKVEFYGSTLVNKVPNFNNDSWGSVVQETVNSSRKITITADGTTIVKQIKISVKPSTNYLIKGITSGVVGTYIDVVNVDGTSLDTPNTQSYSALTTNNDNSEIYVRCVVESSVASGTHTFEDVCLYEITQETSDKIGVSLTDADVERMFPYVDGIKPVRNPMVRVENVERVTGVDM